MKKIVVLFVLSFVSIPSLYSQIKFGVKAGTSYSSLLVSDDLKPDDGDIKYRFGFIGGITSEIRLIGESIFLHPEFLIHQKGFNSTAKFADDPFTPDYSFKTNYVVNYLEMPVLVKVKFGKFYALVGPSILLGIGGNYYRVYTYKAYTSIETGKVKFEKVPDDKESDESYLDNKIDLSIQGGCGVKVSIITIELRYALGLLNPSDKPDDHTEDYAVKNSSFQLTVGIPIDMKK